MIETNLFQRERIGEVVLQASTPPHHGHLVMSYIRNIRNIPFSGADPGFFLGGGALVSCSTSTPINHIVFFWQNTSCIRKPKVISGGGGGGGAPPPPHPLHPPPRSTPDS